MHGGTYRGARTGLGEGGGARAARRDLIGDDVHIGETNLLSTHENQLWTGGLT